MRLTPKIKMEYEKRRKAVRAEHEQRLDTLYAQFPRLADIAAARRRALFALGLYRLHTPDAPEDTKALLQDIEALNAEQSAILRAAGLPEDALAPRYVCARCKDTGFVGDALQTPCACLKQRMAAEAFKSANLREEERFERFRTDIFQDEAQRKRSAKLRDICMAYADAFPGDGRGLLLSGEAGLGKSFLLGCIAHRLLERGFGVVDITVYKLMQDMIRSIQERTPMPDYTEPDVLILDDLGSEPNYGELTVNTLFSILNERQSLGRPTLFGSNMSEAQILEIYDERLYSRIVTPRISQVYRLTGKDLRRVNITT